MKRLFLDTNVILDLLAERNPFYISIAKIATLADLKKIKLVSSPLSFTTIDYVLNRFESRESVLLKLRKFKMICEVCEVNELTIEKSLNSDFKDFEDAVQYFSALQSNCSIFLTRNSKDFKNTHLPMMTADEYINSLLF